MRRAFVLGVVCGALVALSEPPFGWWPLGWLGFAGIAFWLPGLRWGARLALGFGAGLGQYVIGLWWVQEFSIPGCVALMIVSALFVAAAVLVTPSATRAHVAAGLPAAMVLSDWLRARFPLGGFPLGGASLGQTVSPLVPTVRIGGSLLLTGETVLAGVVVAGVASAALRPAGRAAGGIVAICAATAIAVAIPIAGLLSPSGAGGRLPPLRVALVQGGGPRGTRAIHTDPEIVFERHMAAAASIRPPVDLVGFPEGVQQTSVDFTTTADSAQLAGLAAGLDATVVAGVEQDVGVRRYLNEIAAWSPTGSVVGTYVKQHLVPFGEYVPWRSFLQHFFNLSDVPYDAIPGHGPGILRTPAGPLAVMISYEVFFDGLARAGVRAGGQVLVVPTNTASYRSSQVPTQELAADRMRAWETGRWLVQVTPTGYSGIVTPRGRVVARSTLGRQEVIQGTVPRETGSTVYDDVGGAPVALAALVVLLLAALLGGADASPASRLRRAVRRNLRGGPRRRPV
jgi:apolipoprotein N-acyltransferase